MSYGSRLLAIHLQFIYFPVTYTEAAIRESDEYMFGKSDVFHWEILLVEILIVWEI